MPNPDSAASQVLVLAPHGRDGAVACALLRSVDMSATAFADPPSWLGALGDETGFAVATEEVLRSADLRALSAWIASQPSWSDLPFIVLTQRGGGPERNPAAARLSELLGNVTFLERPFHPTTFVSVARTALKGRRRQFEARARIDELHEGEERLRTALQAGRLGAWEMDPASGTLSVSQTCKAVFGRAAADPFSYRDLLAGIHPDDEGWVHRAFRDGTESGQDFTVEYRNVWPDGSVHWAEVRARTSRHRTGGSRLLGVSSDITARKAAEHHLQHLNETLERRVAERTHELEVAHAQMLEETAQRERAEDLLRQAQKMEAIGQLTGGVAHDFNNLLMAILGNLDLLKKLLPEDARALRLLDGALQGAHRGAALTQRLLAFARRQDLKVEPCDLANLVGGMTELLERSVGSEIELRIDLPETPAFALVDANQIELALLNLGVNARDAMPEGGVLTIVVDGAEAKAGEELSAGQYVRLLVGDTGHGMDAEVLKRATEPFFSTKDVGKGTGLGLSMIHGLAIQLNGALRLTSEVGHGTTAELWLPAVEAEGARPPAARAPAPEERLAASTILVVDDDALIAMSTVGMLEDLGHRVIEAGSGARALEILGAGEAIDLMITDYAMPRMTGAQLAKAARELRPDLPILLATGYADPPKDTDIDIPRLAKPYQQAQLASEIRNLIRR